MGLFGNKDKDIQNAEYEEISEVSEPVAASSEANNPETVTGGEAPAASSEDTASSYNYGTDESVTYTPDPVPATQIPAEPADVIPEAAVEPVSEPIPAVEDTFSMEEERVPVGKYNLEKLYTEIGKEYCDMHSTNPEDELREKVGIVNAIKRQSQELKDQLTSLCRSPWMLLLVFLLGVAIVLSILGNPSVSSVVTEIPNIVILLGCLIIFFSAAANRLSKAGFTLINIVLTIAMICCFIPVVSCLILGIFMKLRGDSSDATLSTSLIVIGVLVGLISFLFFGNLRKTTKSARAIAGGGLVELKSSFFVTLVVFLDLVFNIVALVMNTAFKTQTINTLQNYLQQADEYFKQADLSEFINFTLNQDPRSELFTIISLVAEILLLIVVMVILSKIRNANRTKDELAEE